MSNAKGGGAPVEVNQADVKSQQARAAEYSCPGLASFTIAGIVIISLAVFLRFWSRKIAKAAWTADDWTIFIAWLLTVGAQACYLGNNFHARTCYHTYTLTNENIELQGKLWYAWNLLYTTGYPIARISLCLLYMRVFVKRWFRMCCWFLIFCFAGYSIGSFFADIFQAWPLAANWDTSVKLIHTTNRRHLFLANAGFNIATDTILLVLPLFIIWKLKMNWPQKVGLSAVFLLGGLTVIASIFRMQSYVSYTGSDPNFSLQADAQWWTIAELDLGILCPCLVVFGPLIRRSYGSISSRMSTPTRSLLNKWTGYSSSSDSSRPSAANTTISRSKSNATRQYTKGDDYFTDYTASMRSHRHSDLEGGTIYGDSSEKVPNPVMEHHQQQAPPADTIGVAMGSPSADPTPTPLSNPATPTPWADTGISTNNTASPPVPAMSGGYARGANGMATNQNAALANLDPRASGANTSSAVSSPGLKALPLGTSTTATATPGGMEESKRKTLMARGHIPGHNQIGVTTDFKLERE